MCRKQVLSTEFVYTHYICFSLLPIGCTIERISQKKPKQTKEVRRGTNIIEEYNKISNCVGAIDKIIASKLLLDVIALNARLPIGMLNNLT